MARSEDVPAIADRSWLYTGAEGPRLRVHDRALAHYLAMRDEGPEGRVAHGAVEARLRRRLEMMLGLRQGDVALVSNASEALNIVATALGLGRGDTVVVNDLEYPSVVLPWLRMATSGVEVRIARRRGWELPVEAISTLVDSATRVIALSHVSYVNGWRHDVTEIARVAERVGAVLILDATQSLGVVPVPAELACITVASSYKWLLGGHGIGVLGWNRERIPLREPAAVGWRSVDGLFRDDRYEHFALHDDARRYEVGFPSYPSIYLLDAGTEWLTSFPRDEVRDHVLRLSGELVKGLAEQGWEVMTPTDPERRAGNVSFVCAKGEEIAVALARERIYCWGGDGRVRVSVHLFNGSDDVNRVLCTLASLRSNKALT